MGFMHWVLCCLRLKKALSLLEETLHYKDNRGAPNEPLQFVDNGGKPQPRTDRLLLLDTQQHRRRQLSLSNSKQEVSLNNHIVFRVSRPSSVGLKQKQKKDHPLPQRQTTTAECPPPSMHIAARPHLKQTQLKASAAAPSAFADPFSSATPTCSVMVLVCL